MNDYSGMYGLGFGIFLVGLIIYLGTIALILWIGYLIMRTAVKNGVLLADAERARRAGPPAPGYPGAQPGYPGGPGAPGGPTGQGGPTPPAR